MPRRPSPPPVIFLKAIWPSYATIEPFFALTASPGQVDGEHLAALESELSHGTTLAAAGRPEQGRVADMRRYGLRVLSDPPPGTGRDDAPVSSLRKRLRSRADPASTPKVPPWTSRPPPPCTGCASSPSPRRCPSRPCCSSARVLSRISDIDFLMMPLGMLHGMLFVALRGVPAGRVAPRPSGRSSGRPVLRALGPAVRRALRRASCSSEDEADGVIAARARAEGHGQRMIVAFSVTPLGVGEDVGEYVADAVRVVRESGLPQPHRRDVHLGGGRVGRGAWTS